MPAGVEQRRMQIYASLFYNTIEGLLAGNFPVARKVLGDQRWHSLVRDFVRRHPSESPLFLEISQEFLAFIEQRGQEPNVELPEFLLELLHYEWIELALSVSELEIPEEGIDPQGNLLEGEVVVSPLIRCLAYRYPVHQIGADHQPQVQPSESTELIVYRRRDDRVRFMRVNSLTLRLVALLSECLSGREALEALAGEAASLDRKVVFKEGIATLERLREAHVILGSRSLLHG